MNPFDEVRQQVNLIAWARFEADLCNLWRSTWEAAEAFRRFGRVLRPLRYGRLPRAIRSHRRRPRKNA